jgi:hypothetical protein
MICACPLSVSVLNDLYASTSKGGLFLAQPLGHAYRLRMCSTILLPLLHAAFCCHVLVQPMTEIVSGTRGHSSAPIPDEKARRGLARIGLHAFLKMLFLDNFVHGDLHPGDVFSFARLCLQQGLHIPSPCAA